MWTVALRENASIDANGSSHRKQPLERLNIESADRQDPAYSVEKLCFEMSGDLICDLSGIAYCMYEGGAEAA
jgi:hypothetical protein